MAEIFLPYNFIYGVIMSDFRPKRFNEIVGCESNNKILLSIARHGGPSTILLNGAFGCGKTTSARLFSKAVNCTHLTDDICGECASCKCNIDDNPCYSEFDSSLVNRVDNIRDLYEDLMYVPAGRKRVITFDEFHLTTRAAQSALLKLFEDAPKNIYYVLCTTDKNAILPAIISRSLTLEFKTQSKDTIVENIKSIAKDRSIEISDKVANLIALRSKGHLRDAHKLFEKYLLLGENDFLNSEESCYVYIAKYFANVLWLVKNSRANSADIKKHKNVMIELANKIMNAPIALVKDDYQNFFFDLAKKTFDKDFVVEPIIDAIAKAYDARSIMNLYKVALDDFTMSSFENDIRFQTALYSIYQRLLMGI